MPLDVALPPFVPVLRHSRPGYRFCRYRPPAFSYEQSYCPKIPARYTRRHAKQGAWPPRSQTHGAVQAQNDGRETLHEEVSTEEARGVRRRRRPGRRRPGRLRRLRFQLRLRRQDHHCRRQPHPARRDPHQRRGRSAQGAGLHARSEGVHRLHPAQHGHRGGRGRRQLLPASALPGFLQ